MLPAVRAPQQLAQLNPNNPSRLSILLLLLLSQKDTQPCAHEVTEQRLQRSGCPLPPFFPAHQGWPTLSGKWPDKNVLGFLSLLQRLSPAIVMRTNTDYMEMNEPGWVLIKHSHNNRLGAGLACRPQLANPCSTLLITRRQAQNGVIYAKPQVTKPGLGLMTVSAAPRKGI